MGIKDYQEPVDFCVLLRSPCAYYLMKTQGFSTDQWNTENRGFQICLFYVYECFAYVDGVVSCTFLVPLEARRGHQIP